MSTPHQAVQGSVWLKDEFLRRKKKNPSYSLRAFAKYCDLSSGALCEILQGKRVITEDVGRRLIGKFSLPQREREALFAQISLASSSRNLLRSLPWAKGRDTSYLEIKEKEFSPICDPLHFTLLSLLDLPSSKHIPKELSLRLGVSETKTKKMLERLLHMGFLQWENCKYIPVKNLSTTQDVPSKALKKYHLERLRSAQKSILKDPTEQRDITSITMTIDSSKIPAAKELIRRFRRQMAKLLETGNPDEVYSLNIQLFPLTRTKKHEQ